MTREEIEKRIDDLALNHAARHDQDVKAELEKLRETGCENGRAATLGTSYLWALDPPRKRLDRMVLVCFIGGGRSLESHPYDRWSPNSMKSYLFERRAVMSFGILRSEAGPLKNFAVLLSYETVGNFAARHGPPILTDVVKVIAQFTL